MPDQEILTPREAADFLRVSYYVLLEHAKRGRVPAAKVGGSWRFSRRKLTEWLENGGSLQHNVEDGEAPSPAQRRDQA